MRKLWTICFLVSSALAFSQQREYTVKDITDRLQKKYDSLQDATAHFTQHVKFGFSKIEQNFSGTFRMKRPNNYRVETEYQTLVTDGKTVWSYSPVNKQVLIDHYKETPDSFAPEQFLLNLPANYFASLIQQEKKGEATWFALKLVPKDDQSFIKSMKMWIEEVPGLFARLRCSMSTIRRRMYDVQEIRINTGLPDGTFKFTAPAGTEVVDLR